MPPRSRSRFRSSAPRRCRTDTPRPAGRRCLTAYSTAASSSARVRPPTAGVWPDVEADDRPSRLVVDRLGDTGALHPAELFTRCHRHPPHRLPIGDGDEPGHGALVANQPAHVLAVALAPAVVELSAGEPEVHAPAAPHRPVRGEKRVEEVPVVCGDRSDVDGAHSGTTAVQTSSTRAEGSNKELTSKSEIAG